MTFFKFLAAAVFSCSLAACAFNSEPAPSTGDESEAVGATQEALAPGCYYGSSTVVGSCRPYTNGGYCPNGSQILRMQVVCPSGTTYQNFYECC